MKDSTPVEAEVMPQQVVLHQPKELMRQASDVAGICKDIVVKTAVNIQGKKYIRAEGWMSIATAHGCIASSRTVERVEGGWKAIGEIRRISDGVLLSQAEGFVGKDEKRWSTADEYACRAMCQTRAISRACRAAFAHVVVLMDAGLSTTPAEEVPQGGFNEPQAPRQPCRPKQQQNAPQSQPDGKDWRFEPIPKFMASGRNAHYAGKTLGDMKDEDLLYWCQNYEPETTGKYAEKNKALRAMLDDAEQAIMEKMERCNDDVPMTDETPMGNQQKPEDDTKKRALLQLLFKQIKDPKDIPMLERHLQNRPVAHFNRIVLPFGQKLDTLEVEVLEYLSQNFKKWFDAANEWTAAHPE